MSQTGDDIFSLPVGRWMASGGPDADVVISTRVRLARNICGLPFPHMMSDEQAERLVERMAEAIRHDRAGDGPLADLHLVRLADLGTLQRQVLVEKHLISPQHAAKEDGAVAIRGDQAVSVMVNEEDHLRIQALMPALQLDAAFALCAAVDDALETEMDFAWHERYGYLTACPTNTGTAMRASVMLHLPALVMTNQTRRLAGMISKLSCVVRGMYGEGSEAAGHIFQVSNQITMGQSEQEVIAGLAGLTARLIAEERRTREALLSETRLQLEDRIWRAWGTLTSARVLTSREALRCVSDLKLGVDLGVLDNLDANAVNTLMYIIRPAYLQILAGGELPPDERDIRRATLMRQHLMIVARGEGEDAGRTPDDGQGGNHER